MIKDKYPLKSEKVLDEMLDSVINGRIEETMWTRILEKMYEENDATVIQ